MLHQGFRAIYFTSTRRRLLPGSLVG